MVSYIILLPVLTVVLYVVQQWFTAWRARSRLPPGPLGWPLVGNIGFFLTDKRHWKLMETGQKYGGIFSTNIGVLNTVWITSYKLFREATIDHVWDFAARPKDFVFGDLVPGIISSGVDDDSKEIRRWSLVSLRSLGFGKTDMQSVLLDEASNLIDEIRDTAGRPIDPRDALANASANVIAAITLGKTFHRGDAGFTFVHHALTEGLRLVSKRARLNAFPLLKPLANKTIQLYKKYFHDSEAFVRATVEEHEPSRDPNNPRDYIDMWLEQAEKSGGNSGPFTRDRLYASLVDLFGGGFETTTTSLQWVLAMMLHHPEVQAKVHRELDGVAQKGQMVTLNDRDALPYTEAVIWETLRVFTVLPFAVPHTATTDAVLGGLKIPKNTRVMIHLFSIHHDPALWDSPEEFRPERFVVDGKLKMPEYFVPFSAGRRSCIGEQLARKELFLFFSNLANNFVFKIPQGSGLPSLKLNDSVVMHPDSFKVVARERQ